MARSTDSVNILTILMPAASGHVDDHNLAGDAALERCLQKPRPPARVDADIEKTVV
jgi:hypothetical protein